MQYKALFLDVDGTLIPYQYNALPSDTVASAVKKAQNNVTVCLVTGRSYGFVKHVLEKLHITSGYAVVNTGAVIVDLSDESIVHEQPINPSDVQAIIDVLQDEKISFFVKDNPLGRSYSADLDRYSDTSGSNTIYMMLTEELYSEEKIDKVLKRLSQLTEVNMHKTKHKDPTKFGINITHLNATKLHGVQFLLEKLNVQREEVIGVGDSYNDFPLLMASGLKVAMRNAIEDLKAIADYVAPPVTEDGVADVIEKYILRDK